MNPHEIHQIEKILTKIFKKINKDNKKHEINMVLITFLITLISTVAGAYISYEITRDKTADLSLNLNLVEDGTIQVEITNDDAQNPARDIKIFMREYNVSENWVYINSNDQNRDIKEGRPHYFNISVSFYELPLDNDAFDIIFLENGIDLSGLNLTDSLYRNKTILLLNKLTTFENRYKTILENQNVKDQLYEFKISCDNCKDSNIFIIKDKIYLKNTVSYRCIGNKTICGYFIRYYYKV